MYAGRKRRKPAHKGVTPIPNEGAKSNPSKRHRDRLNSELDRLASLLPFPEDVVSSLDKLSILRLSVSYLRTKSFFSVALKNQPSDGMSRSSSHNDDNKGTRSADCHIPEGDLLLQALNGFVLVVTGEGIVFFCSHTIQDYLGFHQTDVMHQSVFELIHTEDQQEFRRNLHWALNPPSSLVPPTDFPTGLSNENKPVGESVSTFSCLVSYNPDQLPPENSSFLERSFVCRFRCLLDNSSGFLALNIQGRLKFLHGQSRSQSDSEVGTPPQLAMFAIATPLQSPAILEIRTRNMIFRTKHKLDFTPMACDAKGKIVLGYTEAELRVRGTGYQFIHAADMLYCAENHVRMIKTGESGLTVFRLLTKDNRWKWVQANARLVYKNGKPDYIIATQRPLVEEEGGEHLRKRSMHLPFTFATGEALLYQTGYPLHGFPDSFQDKTRGSKSKKCKEAKRSSDNLDPKSLLGALMSQDGSVYVSPPDPEPVMSYHSNLFSQQRSETDCFGGLFSGDTLHTVSEGEARKQMTSDDTLLATLDSLSLDGEETCSNSELFSALENLGLNAEDLELLLLDKRMIQVELDPNHIPTLSDLLTNNEILSYIHSSLESGTNGEEQGNKGMYGLLGLPPTSDSVQSVSHEGRLTPAIPAALPSTTQPIIQLSQQMQQHISAGNMVKPQPGQTLLVSQPGTVDTNILPGILNHHWVVMPTSQHDPNNHTLNDLPTVLKTSQSNGDHKDINLLLQSSQQCHLQQGQHSIHLQTNQHFRSQNALLPGFQDHFEMTIPESIPNGHAANMQVGQANYGISSTHSGGTALNGMITPDLGHYQNIVASSQPSQLQEHQPLQVLQAQVLPSFLPQCTSQSAALDLEQLLGLSQPQQNYRMFNTAMENTAHSKLENGCPLRATNAAYMRTCLMPNGNGMATTDIPVSCPGGLPTLQDCEKSGFYL